MKTRGISRISSVLCALGLALAPRAAAAQPLKNNHYAIDVFQGPVLAPSDVIGIAGAYAGVAEGIAGMAANAAAPAVRESYNVSNFNWDLSPSVSFPINLFGTRDDFDNSGASDHAFTDFYYVTVGGLAQVGPLGFGATAEFQRYSLTSTAKQGGAATVVLGKYHALAALRILGDQLVLGAGARVCTLGLSPKQQDGNLTMVGAAPEIGILVRPDWRSFRVGATVRLPVNGGRLYGGGVVTDANGVRRSGGLILPEDVVLPWEIQAGVAVQVGPRPLNPEWIDPRAQEAEIAASLAAKRRKRAEEQRAELAEIRDLDKRAVRKRAIDAEEAARRDREDAEAARLARDLESERRARAWNWPREHLLLTFELLVTGPVENGVSLGRFLGQNQAASDASVVGTSGASASFSPRLGVETEPLPGRLHTRAGTYYEPSRIGDRVGRQHFTFGADVRLFTTTFWGLVPPTTYKAQAYADLSPRYQSVSMGLGVLH
jgi:hypothetical protein